MATLYVDYENGDNNFSGTSFSPLASGTDGRITSNTFSSATANFANNGTLAPTKNLFGSSERLDNNGNAWTVINTTLTRSTINPPSGLYTTWNLLESSSNSTHALGSVASSMLFTNGISYTFSVYAKSNNRNQVTLQFTADGTRAARFDLSNGTVAQTGSNATASISSAGDGWYRISITATSTGTSLQSFIYLTNDSHNAVTAQSYLGDTNRGVYISAPQIEAASSATSYEKPPDQYLSIFNGTIYAVYHIVQYISSTSLWIIQISGGTALANQSVDRQFYIGGRWKNLDTGATAVRIFAGDEIRVMASPDPTLVGNATFTSSILQSTINISSSTNASPISITTSSNHGFSTGDTVIITGHTTNTNANGTWEITVTGSTTFTLNTSTGNGVGGASGTTRLRNNTVIRLASAVTANIASLGNRGNGRTAWTQSANITASLNTSDFKEGDCSDSIDIAAAFTTGKAAYKATGTLNLSGYQQVSFWIKNTAGAVPTTGNLSLRLCTDTTGDTSVHTVAIPALVAASRWVPITVNLATNLNSAIQSIALYVDNDIGAQTILLCNIIACKASSSDDSLTLQSLISKNTASEGWYGGLQSINGTRLMLDNETNTLPTSANNRGYIGTSETTSLYKRETLKTPMVVSGATVISLPRGALANNPINYQFGYDRTNMTSQSGMTFFDGLNGNGNGIYPLNLSGYLYFNKLGMTRYNQPLVIQNTPFSRVTNYIACNGGSGLRFSVNINYGIMDGVICCFCSLAGVSCDERVNSISWNNIIANSNVNWGIGSTSSWNGSITNCVTNNNGAYGMYLNASSNYIVKNCISNFNGTESFITGFQGANNIFINCASSGNARYSTSGDGGPTIFKNCSFSETTRSSYQITAGVYNNVPTIFINENGGINNTIYIDAGVMYTTAAVRYSNSGVAWAMAPTSTIRNSSYPLNLSIAKVAVNANSLVTVKAWMRRTSTLLTTGLRIKADQIAGVSSDITSYMSGSADTWEQVTLNFTPTEVGVVEILAECFGGSTFTAYVDDISITQV